jgi:RNA polymerase sigma factor (sigma-70 family)
MIDFKALEDRDLYGMCLAGDEKAWEYLYNYILKIASGWRLGWPEDVAGQVTVELLEGRLETIQKKDRFRYFVKLMTNSRIKDGLRSARTREAPIYRPSGEDDEEEVDPRAGSHKPDQEEGLNCLEVMTIVDAAVEKLSAICQKVIREYLKFKIGLYDDYQELSRVLGMSVPNISSRVIRCMKTLTGLKEIQALQPLIGAD